MKLMYLALPIALLTGCATDRFAGPGAATRTYERVAADGSRCSVTDQTTMSVDDVEVSVDKDCAMTVKAKKVDGTAALQQAVDASSRIIESVIPLIPTP